MAVIANSKISPCLWFECNAEAAARFYTSLFPNSSIDRIQLSPTDTPGNEGDALLVLFTLADCSFQALNGPKHDTFNDGVSLSVSCEDQTEVDRYWDALTANGGKPVACGWLKGKFGFSRQIIPRCLPMLLADPDAARAKRVMEAMMKMVKIDVAVLEAAAA
jgi:predicted 3-demethylubiquinone-9 3-methyltransferase (glyoxalase superfamily)